MAIPSTTLNETYIPALCYYVLTQNMSVPTWVNVRGFVQDSMVPQFIKEFRDYRIDFLDPEDQCDFDVPFNFGDIVCSLNPLSVDPQPIYVNLRELGMYDPTPAEVIMKLHHAQFVAPN